MKKDTKIVHVNTWEEFKKLAKTVQPTFIAYTVQKAPLSRPPLGLRLVFSSDERQYVFLDFANGSALRRTKLPEHCDDSGNAWFKEEELRDFIQRELGRNDISIVSFEVLGY